MDGTKIKTFSNRSYDYTMTPQWHVVVEDDGKYAGKPEHSIEQLVVLARRAQETQQEIFISYR